LDVNVNIFSFIFFKSQSFSDQEIVSLLSCEFHMRRALFHVYVWTIWNANCESADTNSSSVPMQTKDDLQKGTQFFFPAFSLDVRPHNRTLLSRSNSITTEQLSTCVFYIAAFGKI
jgi:hypothetical protein